MTGTTRTVLGAEHRTFEVRLGELDAQAVDLLMHGQCHALAYTIHDLTGWQLVWTGNAWCYGFDDCQDIDTGVCDCQPSHVLVRLPDGRFLDATGAQTEDELLQASVRGEEEPAWFPLGDGVLDWIATTDTWRVPDMEFARSVAAQVMALATREQPAATHAH